MKFKAFLESDAGMGEEKDDILKTLAKIPPSHRNLIKGFNWKFQGGNTLAGDDHHVGYMDDHEKEIAVAAPWNYGREFTALHEIAHTVWERLPPQTQQQWAHLFKKTNTGTPDGQNNDSLSQPPEEIFCMVYANCYAKHKLLTYYKPEWFEFIKNLPA
jgi:hypothetical protein